MGLEKKRWAEPWDLNRCCLRSVLLTQMIEGRLRPRHLLESAVIVFCRKYRPRRDQEAYKGHPLDLKAALKLGAWSMV